MCGFGPRTVTRALAEIGGLHRLRTVPVSPPTPGSPPCTGSEDRSLAAVRLKRVAAFAGGEECSRIVQFKCLEDAQVEACRCFGDR